MPYNHIYSYKKLRLTSNVGTLVLSCSNLSAVRSRIWYHKLRAQQLAGAAIENDSLKRPARATGRDKTKDKTLNALEAKRKAKDKKKRTSPKQRSSSAMDMEMSESDSEDGQISKVDQEDERLFGKLKSAAEPAFEKIVTSTWVRYLIGTNPDTNPDNMPVYRIYQIKGLAPVAKPYKLSADRICPLRTSSPAPANAEAPPLSARASSRNAHSRSGGMTTTKRVQSTHSSRCCPRHASGGSAVLEVERKCPERKNRVGGVPAVVDSSAQLRTIPQLFESATPTSSFMQTGDAEPAALGVAPPLPKKGLSPSPAKTSIPSRSISGTFKCVQRFGRVAPVAAHALRSIDLAITAKHHVLWLSACITSISNSPPSTLREIHLTYCAADRVFQPPYFPAEAMAALDRVLAACPAPWCFRRRLEFANSEWDDDGKHSAHFSDFARLCG
ncbi:hypothetical protein FB451DRAFT_1571981 [Mycena latifolia]|nr:hypothetical protein FB451DRAFT_1571981 [Mycena latifolia]